MSQNLKLRENNIGVQKAVPHTNKFTENRIKLINQ